MIRHIVCLLVIAGMLSPLAGGCPGSVKLTKIDDFGTVKSAIWLHLDVDGEDNYESHRFIVSNKAGLCKTLQTALVELAAIQEDRYQNYDDYDDYCELYDDYYTTAADHFDKFMGPGGKILNINFVERDDGDREWDVEPDDGTFDAYDYEDDDDDYFFSLWMSYYEENPSRLYADALDDQYHEDSWCFEDYDDYEDLWDDIYDAAESYDDEEDGEITVTHKGKKKIKLQFQAEIEDEDDDSAGDVEGTVTFTYCPVEIETDYYFYWYMLY